MVITANYQSFYKATIILNKAQLLEGVEKNNIEIIFNDFSEIEQIIQENNIDKSNLWTIDFR